MVGDPQGFLKSKREELEYRPVCERVKDYELVFKLRPDSQSQNQASRCMDCGVPFCHFGCPIGNYIPEWNELVFQGQWQKAIEVLNATNNWPEITGRVCPAPCEYACVLGINDDPVTIRANELGIIEHAFKHKLIKSNPPKKRTGKKVALIGSGPAGLSCAAQLNQAGHKVTVFEKDEKFGGIMRFGIPDFKLEKRILDRRLKILKQDGVRFVAKTNVGVDLPITKLKKEFDAICLAGGSREPRDLKIPGRELTGVYFAMEYLAQSNRRVAGEKIPADQLIDAKGKKVVVIGGGDTGSDCVGTAHRQGAACVVQIELLSQPPTSRLPNQPWPIYPLLLKTSSSHEEGGERQWSILTKEFKGQGSSSKGQVARVKKLLCVRVANNCWLDKSLKEIPGTDFEIEADLVFLALGFLHPQHHGLLEQLGVEFDQRGNVQTDGRYMTSVKNVFAAGDMRRGQSLIVWAISEGRKAAHFIDKRLMGKSSLPTI